MPFLNPNCSVLPTIVWAGAWAFAAMACSGGDDPSAADFQFTGSELESAASGTYTGTLTSRDGEASELTLEVESSGGVASAASGLRLRPQCGNVSRDLTSDDQDMALSYQCGTLYETTMPVSGMLRSEAFEGPMSGTLVVIGVSLDGDDWVWSLELDDGSRLSAFGADPIDGQWYRADEEVGTFSLIRQ
jgi:hypothetical protein